MLKTRAVNVAVGVETTAGTAATSFVSLTSADATIPATEISKPLAESVADAQGLPAFPNLVNTAGTIEISLPVHVAQAVRAASSANISPPPYDALLQSCGLERVDSKPNNSATYALSTGVSCTIRWQAAGRQFQMVGCRGSYTVTADGSAAVRIVFAMQGRITEQHTYTAAAYPTAAGLAYRPAQSRSAVAAFNHVNALGVAGAAFTLPGDVLNFSLDGGVNVARIAAISAADGQSLPQITAAAPTLSFSTTAPLLTSSAADVLEALVLSSENLKMAITFASADTGVSLGCVFNSLSLQSLETADDSGLLVQNAGASVIRAGAAVPLQLVFTTPAP